MADNNSPSAPPDTMRNADDLNPPQQSYADLLNALGIDDAPPSYTHIPPSLAPDRRYSLPPTSVPDYSQPRYHQPPTRPDKPHFSVDSPNLLNTPPPAGLYLTMMVLLAQDCIRTLQASPLQAMTAHCLACKAQQITVN